MNAVQAQSLHQSGEAAEEQERIVNVTPDQHEKRGSEGGAAAAQASVESASQLATSAPADTVSLSKGRLVIRDDDSDLLKLAAPRLTKSVASSDHTAPTEASTATTGLSNRNSYSTIGTDASILSTAPSTTDDKNQASTNSSNTRLLFYKTPSQQKLQHELQTHQIPPSASLQKRSSFTSMLRLDQEEMNEGLEELQLRASMEAARKSLNTTMKKWSTPYDIDPPKRVRLATNNKNRGMAQVSSKSFATTDTTSTGFISTSTESDPMAMERQIWNGIEALMADAFSTDGGESSVCTEDILPKSLLRAMSHSSLSTTNTGPPSHLTPDEYDEIKMAQAALNSFMDMLLPEQEGATSDYSNTSAMPSLETMQDSSLSDKKRRSVDQIAMAEVALHNFMDVLLRDLEDEEKQSESEHSSKVQILDLFQWSLRVNVDAQEKIRFLKDERQRLEDERQRELEELLETERRLEQERARRKMEEEKRRKKIRQLEQHLAQEQLALAAANRKAYHAMKRNQYRQPPIPEEGNHAWASTGKPVVVKEPARNVQEYDDASLESEDAAMQYIVTSSEPSPQKKAPEFEQEGSLPSQASVQRMPSWTIIGEKRIVMASTDSVESASHTSSVTNHLPSSFHENDAIRNLSDSDSSKKASRRQQFSSGNLGRAISVASSMDMPDLSSINEDSILAASIATPPYIATAGNEQKREYPGGVPRAASGMLKAEPSFRHGFERVASSSGRVGLVSASADVYTDDVSRYSFNKFNAAKPVDGGGPKERHTKLISVGSAGDIHQIVGSTVRFNESPDSSDFDEYSSSSSEEVTIDSDLHRDAQTDAKKPVPLVSRKYGSGGKKKRLGGRLKRSIKAVRDRGKCVTTSWFCESANKRYGDISKQSKRLEQQHSTQLEKLASQECLLHSEDDPYDRSHVLEPTRLTIDDTGFVVDHSR